MLTLCTFLHVFLNVLNLFQVSPCLPFFFVFTFSCFPFILVFFYFPVVESAAAGSADTFRISDGGDAQPNGDGAGPVPDGLARPIGDHEGVAGSGVAVDDPMSSVGFIREVGDSADCRELLKDIVRVVHDDDDAGSAEAHDSVAGVPSSP